MITQAEKASTFERLHEANEAFLIPNPWDVGTAKMLESMGFTALATTSAGLAFSLGKADNEVSSGQVMEHLTRLAFASSLPISADLENGFGHSPDVVAATIREAAATGIVGGSIEDATGRPDEPIYPFEFAVERIRAACEVAHKLPFPFTLTARTENLRLGVGDLKETIRRLQAFQEAGADVLFAPGLKTKNDIALVVKSLDRPVSIMMGYSDVDLSFAELAELGVKRVSVGGSLARFALGAFVKASHELMNTGTFSYAQEAMSALDIQAMFHTKTLRQK